MQATNTNSYVNKSQTLSWNFSLFPNYFVKYAIASKMVFFKNVLELFVLYVYMFKIA